MKWFTSLLATGCIFCMATVGMAASTSPLKVSGATTVQGLEANRLFNQHSKFIDVRVEIDWDAGRVPGAVHLELTSDFTEAGLLKLVSKDQPVVLYCNGSSCMRSSQASALAVEWGFKKVFYYRGGFPDWKARGYPVE